MANPLSYQAVVFAGKLIYYSCLLNNEFYHNKIEEAVAIECQT